MLSYREGELSLTFPCRNMSRAGEETGNAGCGGWVDPSCESEDAPARARYARSRG